MNTEGKMRPQHQIDMLTRAFEIALAVEDKSLSVDPEKPAEMTDEQCLAFAYIQLSGDLTGLFDPPKYNPDGQLKCGWCVHAAGETQEGWDSQPWFQGTAAMRAHTLECLNNPLVVNAKPQAVSL